MLVGNHSACLGNVVRPDCMCVMPLIQSTSQQLFLPAGQDIKEGLQRWHGFAGPWLHIYIQHLYITCFVYNCVVASDIGHNVVLSC